MYNIFELLKNPNTPAEALDVLATNNDWVVRYNVAIHRNTSVKALYELSKDANIVICEAALKNLKERTNA